MTAKWPTARAAASRPLDAVVVCVRARRAVGYALAAVLGIGLLPLIGVGFLVAAGGTLAVLGIVAVLLLQVLLALLMASNVGQRWVVDADSVSQVRAGRATLTWPRDGLTFWVAASPVRHRGIRVGTTRVLTLRTADGGEHRRDVTLLGPHGVTALATALRPVIVDQHAAAVDETFALDHSVIKTFRRKRLRARLVALAALVLSVLLLSVPLFVVGVMAAFLSTWFLVASVGAQVLWPSVGPTPVRIRVRDDAVSVTLRDDAPGPVEHPLVGLRRIEVSANHVRDAVLVLVPHQGQTVRYSLSGRAGEEYRRRVVPELGEIAGALHGVGDRRGVQVVDLHR